VGFARDTLITSTSRAIGLVLNVAVTSASAWWLGPEKRGELAVYIVFGTLLALVTSGGVEMAGAYYGGTKKYHLSEVILAEIFIIFVSTVMSIAAAYVLWQKPPELMNKMTRVGLMICIGCVPAMLANASFWYLHSALGNTLTYCLGNIINVALALVGMFLFCWRTGSSEGAMMAYGIGELSAATFLLVALVRRYKFDKIILNWRCIKDLYIYGIRYYFARMAQFLNVQIGTFIIAFLGTKEETGFFSVSVGMVAKLTILPEIIGAVLLSRVVNGQRASLELTARLVRMVFWVILFVSVLVALFCRPIVRILLSPEFLPAVVPILFMLPGMLLRCCSKTLGIYFNGIGRPGVNSTAIVTAVVINVIAMYFLLPLYGISGAAISTSCGYLADATVLILFYRFIFKHPVSLLIPQLGDIRYLSEVILSKMRH
jgi:O-antigen/teichoic acid export membrane protein